MNTETATLFFAMLAVLSQVAVAANALGWAAGRFVPSVAETRSRFLAPIRPQAVKLAGVVAVTCTLGSLYLSEVAGFRPCRLCWYQRYAMYPQVLLIGAALFAKRGRLVVVAMVLAGAGSLVSIYHILIERFPDLENSTSCDPANPCSLKWVEHFGYVTIPVMALSGFTLIITLLGIAAGKAEEAQ